MLRFAFKDDRPFALHLFLVVTAIKLFIISLSTVISFNVVVVVVLLMGMMISCSKHKISFRSTLIQENDVRFT